MITARPHNRCEPWLPQSPGRPAHQPVVAPFAGAMAPRVMADKPLFHVGNPCDGCYRLDKGLLRVVVESRDGEELVIAFLGPGAMVGELAMIDGLPRSATAVAVKACELSFITSQAFDESLRAQPELYRCLVEALAARSRNHRRARRRKLPEFTGPLARVLLDLAALLAKFGDWRDHFGARDPPTRPCRDGRHRARERQPDNGRVEAPRARNAAVGPILHQQYRRAETGDEV